MTRMTRKKNRRAGWTMAAVVLLCAGCSVVPAPKADPTRFFVLTAQGGAVEPTAGAPLVALRPIGLPDYLRGRALVVRRGDNEVDFRTFARWGEPLEAGLSRLLARTLIARGVAGDVPPVGRKESADAKFALTVHVLACEGRSDGTVLFRATWTLRAMGAGPDSIAVRGDFEAAGLTWNGQDEATLVAALSRATADLGEAIAAKFPAN